MQTVSINPETGNICVECHRPLPGGDYVPVCRQCIDRKFRRWLSARDHFWTLSPQRRRDAHGLSEHARTAA